MIALYIVAAVLNAGAAVTLYVEGRPWWLWSMYLVVAMAWSVGARMWWKRFP